MPVVPPMSRKRYVRARSDEIVEQVNATVNESSGLVAQLAACKARVLALTAELERINGMVLSASASSSPSPVATTSQAKLDVKKQRLVVTRDIGTQTSSYLVDRQL